MNGIFNSQSISKNEMFMRGKIVAEIFHMSEIDKAATKTAKSFAEFVNVSFQE